MRVLTIVDNNRKKYVAPQPKWIAGEVSGGAAWGVTVGGYVLDVVVGCCVGLHWNVGEA